MGQRLIEVDGLGSGVNAVSEGRILADQGWQAMGEGQWMLGLKGAREFPEVAMRQAEEACERESEEPPHKRARCLDGGPALIGELPTFTKRLR